VDSKWRRILNNPTRLSIGLILIVALGFGTSAFAKGIVIVNSAGNAAFLADKSSVSASMDGEYLLIEGIWRRFLWVCKGNNMTASARVSALKKLSQLIDENDTLEISDLPTAIGVSAKCKLTK